MITDKFPIPRGGRREKLSLHIAFLVLGSIMAVDRVGYAQVAHLTVSKAFGAATIPLGGTTSLTFTIGNPDATATQTGVLMNDSLPAGLVVATPNGLTGACDGGTSARPILQCV